MRPGNLLADRSSERCWSVQLSSWRSAHSGITPAPCQPEGYMFPQYITALRRRANTDEGAMMAAALLLDSDVRPLASLTATSSGDRWSTNHARVKRGTTIYRQQKHEGVSLTCNASSRIESVKDAERLSSPRPIRVGLPPLDLSADGRGDQRRAVLAAR